MIFGLDNATSSSIIAACYKWLSEGSLKDEVEGSNESHADLKGVFLPKSSEKKRRV